MQAKAWGDNYPEKGPGAHAIILILSLSLSALFLASTPVSAAPLQKVVGGPPAGQNLDQMLSIAESQFEMVKILIRQGRLERVLPEMRVIFNLSLPEKYEQATAESASIVGDLLVQRHQFELAHQVLDEAYARMRRNENRAAVLKVNAFVFKTEGNLDKAMELYAKAVEIEKQRP